MKIQFLSVGITPRWNAIDWVLLPSYPYDYTNAVGMQASDGWIAGNSGLIYRWNGSQWLGNQAPTTDDLRSVVMNSSTDAWAAGANGSILRWDGSEWKKMSSPTTVQLNSMAMVSADDGWAVGKAGVIVLIHQFEMSYTTYLPLARK